MTTPTTKMVKAPETTQMVKIKALRDIRLDPEERLIRAGDVAEVPEHVAKEFCDQTIEGNYSFSGERSVSNSDRFQIKRAERVV